ncbi:hypothetical protein C2857_001963 [Epichloe festucae Fl1]|uniref:PLD phosphodiesterase domain-containing protein n=1 Tax=Epichloe festucae (strain Fl1) TaxID=877507 RepID=A0A7S9KND6_EPIFF|nr:hypothetical protein C2857_001963 [Epichloe festucae Fl1]
MGSNNDSEDEQLRYAIALSLQNHQLNADERDEVSKSNHSKLEDASSNSLLMNRKKMEEERLARLAAKRSRTTDEEDDVADMSVPKRRMKLPTSQSLNHALVPYPDGIVKRTWARGYDRSNDDIKIEEILQRDKLLLALFSSFQWDEPWLLGKIDLSRTKVILAAFAANESQKEAMRRNAPGNIKFCFPEMHGPGSMHSKLQILKFPNYLRIVVPTGNLVPYDWGETGVMENMVFLIDLPLSNSANKSPTSTLFCTHLQLYLQAMGVEDGTITSLSKYDFTKTANLGFVYSIPGGHVNSSLSQIGFAGLGTTIAALGLATSKPIEVEYACASLGAIKYDLVQSVYNACQGTVDKDLLKRNQNTGSENEQPVAPQLQQHFRIYFPSHKTVKSSRGGKNAAGTICLQEKWWHASTFPKELMRDCVNTRSGLLMHSKLILVHQTGTTAVDTSEKPAWAYVGSANLSESAWGRVVRDKASGQQKIMCRNWECGVVVPARTASEQNSPIDMNIFKGTIPIPMQVPGRRYSQQEHPWFFQKP